MKKNLLFVTALLLFASFTFHVNAQTASKYVRKVLIVNSGMFEFTPPFVDYVTLAAYDPNNGQYTIADTIYTQSAQDILIDSNSVFVAAGDSIVKYDREMLQREAATSFGAPSTIKLALYGNYIIAGNWYGAIDNNIRIFNKSDLSFVDSIPEIVHGAKDMVVAGDTLYVQQNYTNASYEDSAGFFSVVDLTQLKYVRDIHFSNSDEDLGRLHHYEGVIYGLNPASNSVTSYDIASGSSSTTPLSGDVQAGPYGQQSQVFNGLLYFKFNNKLATYALSSAVVKDTSLIDSSLTAFVLDSVNDSFYATQTDFATFKRGLIFNGSGSLRDTMPVGFAPEAIGLDYTISSGVEEIAAVAGYKVYPNPSAAGVSVTPSHGDVYDFSLFSNTGVLIAHQHGLRGMHTMDISSLPAGIYLLRLTSGNSVNIERIIKY